MTQKIYILLILILCLQINAQNQDTVAKPNTLESIENYSKKNKFLNSLHKLVFKAKKNSTQNSYKQERNEENDLKEFEGKIIRKINIETYDPFGYSLTDTTRFPKTKFENSANWLHVKSKKFTIRNMLLFKKDKPLTISEIKESKRLVRSQRFVRQIEIIPIQLQNNPDSVDIDIKVLDSWSLYPTGTFSSTGGSIRLIERNFAGLGHYFSNQYSTNLKDNKHALRSQYQVNNIANTFINAGAIYQIDFKKNYQKTLYIDRPFYSPLTKYAGGATMTQFFYRDSIPDQSNKFELIGIKYNLYDVWFGRSFRINKNSNSEITNFVTALRYNVVNYKENPIYEFDPEGLYKSSQMILGSLAITSNEYKQTKFLFNYGIIEDISVGKIFSITGGLQWKNQMQRPYLGARFSIGKYYNRHFYGFTTEWGSYFNKSKQEQTVFRADALYFSKAYEYKEWKIRQFVNAQIVYGSHRLDYSKDRINLNGKYGIDGFDSYSLRGTKKILLTLQTQTYAPGQFLGFRFSPYLSGAFGWIGDKEQRFVTNNLYSKIALGIVINNDYIIFQNIQLSFAFYPTIPGTGRNIIRTNNIRNDTFELMHFNDLKPATVPFQ